MRIGKVSWIGFIYEKYPLETHEQLVRYGKYVMVEMQLDPSTMPKAHDKGAMTLLQDRIKAGLRVHLMSSLTGPTSVEADYVDPNAFGPLELAWEPHSPYVPSAPGAMAQVLSAVERVANQIEKADIATLLGNMDKLVVDLTKAVNEIHVGQLNRQAVDLLAGLNQTNENLKALLTGEQTQRILDGLAKTSDNAAPAVAELAKTVRRVNNLLSSQQRDIELLIQNLRRLSENLTAITENAKANPSGVLFGEPPPRINPEPRTEPKTGAQK